jgi:hypothetical protein
MPTPIFEVSRRNLLGAMTGGSALAAALANVKAGFASTLEPLGAAAETPAAGWREDGGYWGRIRQQFMLEDGFAYLNTGTLGPAPRPVYDAPVEYWRLRGVNPNENSAVFQDRQDRIRNKAAAFIGATPDEVAPTRDTTEGNTVLCQGLDLKAGDEILPTAYEHASNRETWLRQAKRFGLVVKEVKFPLPGGWEDPAGSRTSNKEERWP